MKKLIYQRSIVLVQVFVLVVFLSCKKSEIKQIEKNKSKNEVIKYPERLPENYCEGCGTAYDPDYFCDLEDGCTNSEPPCGEEIINSISSLNNLSLTDNTNAAYDIRDSMVLSLKGKNYITYYYALSEYAISNNMITLANVVEYWEFSNEIISAANKLLHGTTGEITVTSQFKNLANSFIVEYRLSNPPEEISEVLDIIEQDLNTFEGLTREQIESIIY